MGKIITLTQYWYHDYLTCDELQATGLWVEIWHNIPLRSQRAWVLCHNIPWVLLYALQLSVPDGYSWTQTTNRGLKNIDSLTLSPILYQSKRVLRWQISIFTGCSAVKIVFVLAPLETDKAWDLRDHIHTEAAFMCWFLLLLLLFTLYILKN